MFLQALLPEFILILLTKGTREAGLVTQSFLHQSPLL